MPQVINNIIDNDDLQIIKDIVNNRTTFVCYPSEGRGNAFARILTAHSEDYWWHGNTGFDDDHGFLKSPLDYTELEGQIFQNILFKTIVHLPRFLYEFNTDYGKFIDIIEGKFQPPTKSLYDHLKEEIRKIEKSSNENSMDLLKHFIYSDKRMIFKQHAPLELFKDQLEPRFEIEPTAQFIHLWDEKKYFTRGIQNPNQTKDLYSMYYKPAEDASNILNIKISEFFSTDWHEYSEQFDRLSNFLNLKKPRKNAVRAFMLAYLERNVIFHEEDRGKFFASKKLGWS